jgi:deoxyribodipyrimidine photo-lyase
LNSISKSGEAGRSAKPIVWFRHDLRLSDNPALTAAAEIGEILPVYIWAPEEENDFPYGEATRWWLHQSLAELQVALNGHLILRQGAALDCLRALIRETGATHVYWNRRYEPYAIARNHALKIALRADGIEVRSFNSALLYEPWTVQNKSRRPFQVFTPFYKHCLTLDSPPCPLPKPRLVTASAKSLRLAELKLQSHIDWAAGIRAAWNPGEAGAQHQLQRMLDRPMEFYARDRNFPDKLGTARLSPYLHFGEIGPRQVLFAVQERYHKTGEIFLRQLFWREFAYHLLYHFPHTPTEPLRSEFVRFPWRQDTKMLRSWQRGNTGYPIVDAGMRELWATGWMHNRVRMIVASFLVKHLLLPWQEGAYWFWDTLVDADLANNTLGWQWSAGCGADAAPYFRIFNPVLQGKKFDPSGNYVRQWLPELLHVPTQWIHEPWSLPEDEGRQIRFGPGITYPKPVVDHATARGEALEAFQFLNTKLLSGMRRRKSPSD